MSADPLEIRFQGTVEKVQTMMAGQTRVYVDLDGSQLEAAARLLAAVGERGLLFDVVMTEAEGRVYGGRRRARRE